MKKINFKFKGSSTSKKKNIKPTKNVENNRIKKGSIKRKLILSYIICTVIPLVIVNLFSASQSKITVKDITSQMAMEMVKQTGISISYYTESIENSMTRIIMNDLNSSSINLVAEYAKILVQSKNNINDFEKFELENDIRTQINYSRSLDKNIEDIALLMNDGTEILSGNAIKEGELEKFKDKGEAKEVTWEVIDNNGTKEIYAYKNVINLQTAKSVGLLVVKAKYDVLNYKVNEISLFEGTQIRILDPMGAIISSNSEEDTNEKIIESIDLNASESSKLVKGELVATARTGNGWVVVAEIPQKMLTHRIDAVVNVIWIMVIIIGLIAIAIGSNISRSIVNSIMQLMKLMKKAEEGDLTVVSEIRTNDEMAELGSSFNHMIENIQRLLKQAKSTIEHSVEAADTLKRSSRSSKEGITQLTSTIGNITQGANNQTEDIYNSVDVMEQLASSIQVVIEDTSGLLEHTQGTTGIIEEASSNMKFLDTAISSTHKVSEEISQGIMELNVLTKTIGEIMKLLDDISERTNLLALNASIEAARAGSVGKGFAVVAEEVRNLATQSKESSSHVKEAVRGIEVKVKNTTDLVVKSNQLFDKQSVAINKTYQSLNLMINDLKEISTGLVQVNSRVGCMNHYKDEMSQKIESIAKVIEANAAEIEEVNALSEEQSATIEQFNDLATKLLSAINDLEQNVATFIVTNNESEL